MKKLRSQEIAILVLGLTAAMSGIAKGGMTLYDANGFDSMTGAGWLLVANTGSEESSGFIDGSTTVWHIADTSASKMKAYQTTALDPAQGIVLARVKLNSGGIGTGGIFGYSVATGGINGNGHAVTVCIRNGFLNLKNPQNNGGSFNPVATAPTLGVYRVYAISYTTAGDIKVWHSTTGDGSWSATSTDWTEDITSTTELNGTPGQWEQPLRVDDANPSSAKVTGVLLGEFGNSGDVWDGHVDWIATCDATGEQSPWLCDPTPPTGNCSMTVTPSGTQAASGFEGGVGALPDVLHSKGTPGTYWYAPILHPTYTIVAGDHFVYEIYTNNATGFSGSIDIEHAGGNLRDSGILDQNNFSGHPGTDLSSVAYHQWYSRDFDLSSLAGNSICSFNMAHDGNTSSPSEFFVRSVKIVNGATTQLVVFDPNTWVPDSDQTTCTPGNNGYTSLVGPQIDPDPTGPPTISYTVANVGDITFDWTVTEVLNDCSGTANDYSWLTLSGSGGTLAGSTNTSITATLDSTSLLAGLHTAYLKFENTCALPSACSCFTEDFQALTTGDLNGQGGWAGDTSEFQVEDNAGNKELNLNGSGDSGVAHSVTHAVTCDADEGEISVKADIKLGASINDEATYWIFRAYDGSGNNLGFWQGSQANARGKNPSNANEATANQALTASYQTIEMRINFGCAKVSYYIDADGAGGSDPVLLNTYDLPAGAGSIANVEFQRIVPSGATSAGDYVYFDNVCTSILSKYDIRRIDFTVVGCSIRVLDPRIRWIGPCNSDGLTTEEFTIENNGAYDWTGYQAVEPPSDDDDWLTVAYTSSPVVRFDTATVTATIDWSQVPITGANDDQYGRIQFGATCDGVNFVFDTPSVSPTEETINVMDNTAPPVKIIYNGEVDPSVNDSGGTGYSFELWDGTQVGTVVADNAVGQADDGWAYRIVDGTASGNKTKWRSILNGGGAAMDIDSAVGATVLARVKVVSATGSTFQANAAIYHTSNACGYHWGGANNLVKETNRDISATVTGDDQYHIIRMSAVNTGGSLGRVINLYLDENPSPVLTITGAGSSNDGGLDAIGFGCGSTAAAQDIYFDWVTGTNAGAFAPGEEVGCLGSLIPVSNCNTPKMDVDADSDVDGDDFAEFQKCYTGLLVSPPPLSQLCDCFDDDNDSDIDVIDFNAFVECETGANVPWVTSVNCPN